MSIARLMQMGAAGVSTAVVYENPDIANASYDNKTFSFANQTTGNNAGLVFKPDGTKMFMVEGTNDSVHEYSLSTAYDVSTASHNSTFSVSSQEGTPFGIDLNLDGTKMYVCGLTSDSVYQYSLSTAYNISTASYDSVSLNVSSQNAAPVGLNFNPDGTKMYLLKGGSGAAIQQWNLSTAFDLSTASYSTASPSIDSQGLYIQGFKFNSNGTKVYVVEYSSNTVYQYSLSTAYDLSTISYDSVSFSAVSQAGSGSVGRDVVFNTDYTKMYVITYINVYDSGLGAFVPYPNVYQYSV
jgi:sugar lactone lactonase YvrE